MLDDFFCVQKLLHSTVAVKLECYANLFTRVVKNQGISRKTNNLLFSDRIFVTSCIVNVLRRFLNNGTFLEPSSINAPLLRNLDIVANIRTRCTRFDRQIEKCQQRDRHIERRYDVIIYY